MVDTSGADFVYSDRKDSFKCLVGSLEKRYRAWKERKCDRNLHPIPFLADGPGSGKSRFLQELPRSFVNYVLQDSSDGKETCSKEFKSAFKSPVCINITFSNGTVYSIKEAQAINIEQSVCLRILYQFETGYINFVSFYDSFKSEEFSLSAILQKIGVDASCIVLGIDEVNKIHKSYEIGTQMQKDKGDVKERLLSGLFGLIGGLSCDFTPFFIPVLAGTVIGPMKSAVRESTHPPLHIPLPLLSLESSLHIFSKKNDWTAGLVKTSQQLRQLISDCGGHCRSLEILYDSISIREAKDADDADVALVDWKSVHEEVRVVLNQRYALSTIPLATAIAKSLLCLDVVESDEYEEMKDTKYQDLEEKGLIKLQNGKVKIPHFFVCTFLSMYKAHSLLAVLWRKLLIGEGDDFWWQDWEVFNRNYVAFRLSLFAYLGYSTASLTKFFAGAKMNIPADIELKIPSLETLKVSKIDYLYPSTKAPAFEIGDNVFNGNGAPFDSFLYLEATTGRLLLALQMKLANHDSQKKQVVSDETVDREFKKIERAVANYLPGTDFVCIILGRCSGTFTENKLPSKCVVVSREEQLNFYGESYYHRLNNSSS